jgi:serine phosphatase RsbU (regulator of sigma subunit)
MKYNLLIILAAISINLFSQKGVPYLVNFEPEENYKSSVHAISQDNRGVMLFASNKGILTFDGFRWNLIKTASTPLSFDYRKSENTNLILFKNSLAKLSVDNLGNYIVDSLFSNPDSIYQFENFSVTNDKIYLATESKIFVLDSKYNLTSTIEIPSYSNGQFLFKNQLFVCDDSEGLIQIENDAFSSVQNGKAYKNTGVLFNIPLKNNKQILVFDNDVIATFDGTNFESYSIKDYRYITNSIISSGININDKYFAISTLIGGTVIIEKETGETFSILNYQNGLPDDEIGSTFLDKTGGIWLSHEYGFTRVDLNIPITAYHHFPNLTGNINAVYDNNNQLYVATSEGVFKLDKKEHKKAKEISVKVKQAQPIELVEEPKEQVETEKEVVVAKDELSRKERRLLKRKEKKNTTLDLISNVVGSISDSKESISKTTSKKAEYKVVKKRIYELLSVSYEYTSIANLDDKIRTIFNYNNRIIAYANSGLYEIINNRAKAIFTGNYIYKYDIYDNYIWLYTDDGVKIISFEDNFWNITSLVIDIQDNIVGMKSFGNKIIIAFPKTVQIISLDEDLFVDNSEIIKFPTENEDDIFIRKLENEIYIFTNENVFQIKENELLNVSEQFQNSNLSYKYISDSEGTLWIKLNNSWYGYKNSIEDRIENNFLNLFDRITYITLTNNNLWLVNRNNSIYKIPTDYTEIQQKFLIDLGAVFNAQKRLYIEDNFNIKHSNSDLSFYFLSPSYQATAGSSFQYKFEGLMKDWSNWTTNPMVKFPFIPSGSYKLLYKSKDAFGNETEVREITVDVKPPYYQTFWFFAIVVIIILVAAYFIMKLRERKLKHDKQVLEQKVKERTAEVVRQKEEIAEQKEDIEASIHYAKRIQKAVVPNDEVASKILPEHFILWKPRDIVSGDFYWLTEMDGKTIIVAADCTGHGVPGAFMSMLGVSFLNEIVANLGLEDAGIVLDQLRNKVKSTLSQTGKEGEAKDGMDIAVCIFDPKTKMLQYSGAYNPLYLIRNNEILETKADKMPIGIYIKEKEHFTNHQIQLKKNDTIYIFSDGYVDQFGGEKSGKFKPRRFKELILSMQKEKLEKQKEILDENIENWKGNNEQVDDILVIGIRVN